MATFIEPEAHGKSFIQKDKFDHLQRWQFIKDKDVADKSLSIQKEIMMVAKAKGVSEKDVWQMGMMEYYQALAVLESYNKDVEAEIKKNQKNKY